jgi:ABC-type transport system involved in multi-copper enzyme maturation permease subunit
VLKAVIKQELLLHVMSRRYAVVLAAFVGLTLLATAVRTHVYTALTDDYANAAIQRGQTMAETDYFYYAVQMGYTVEKPPNPLSIFCFGLENDLTRSQRASAWFKDRTNAPKQQSLYARINYTFDITTIVVFVCSLIALLLVHDSVSREREEGTLRVLLAGPVPRSTIIFGKCIAGAVVLVSPLVIGWFLSVLYVVVVGQVSFSADDLLRIAVMAALGCGYILMFFAFGMAVSASCRRSSTALSMCVLVWTVSVLAIPAALSRVMAVPRPQLVKAMGQAYRDIRGSRDVANTRAELRAQYTDTLLADGQVPGNVEVQFGELQREMGKNIRKEIRRQNTVLQLLLSLSPAATCRAVTSDIAGTGPGSFFALGDYWLEFRERFIAKHWEWVGDHAKAASILPVFSPPRQHVSEVLWNAKVGLFMQFGLLVLMLLYALLIFILKRD